jgi:hypothetical protein
MATGANSALGLAIGDFAMKNWANGRLAFIAVAATFTFAVVTARPIYACGSGQCPSDNSSIQGVAANALPTYPEPAAEPVAEPIKLKKFTKQATRSARRAQSRKAQLAQRALAGQLATARKVRQQEAEAKAVAAQKVAPAFINANAQFVDGNATRASAYASPFDKPATAQVTEPSPPAAAQTQTAAVQPPAVELVSADEFNDLDRAAWEANQMPKLMQLRASDSRAELRDDDSRWAQTSTIGKIFVAFGALLTLGSAVRMFMA